MTKTANSKLSKCLKKQIEKSLNIAGRKAFLAFRPAFLFSVQKASADSAFYKFIFFSNFKAILKNIVESTLQNDTNRLY